MPRKLKTGTPLSYTTEHAEQTTVATWAKYNSLLRPKLRLLHAIPNGGWRHPRTAFKLQQEGVLRGIPDLHLPVASGKFHSLYIEMKRYDGRLSEYQEEVIDLLRREGNFVGVCWNSDEAIALIERYLDAPQGLIDP